VPGNEQNALHTTAPTIGRHGQAIHQNDRRASMKSCHIAPERLGCKITLHPPCLQGIHSQHYGLTPPSLVFGKEQLLQYDLLFGAPPRQWATPPLGHAVDLVDHLHDNQNLLLTSDRMGTSYDRLPKLRGLPRGRQIVVLWTHLHERKVIQISTLMGAPTQDSHPDKWWGIQDTAEP
jgi:hypothetical protein